MKSKRKSKCLVKLRTDGTGYWTRRVADVDVTGFCLYRSVANNCPDPEWLYAIEWGELRVFFDTKQWCVGNHGLIYTDKLFKKELDKFLRSCGFSKKAVAGISYSEQGMQGRNYVSFDVDKIFMDELDPLINFVKKQPVKLQIPVETIKVSW